MQQQQPRQQDSGAMPSSDEALVAMKAKVDAARKILAEVKARIAKLENDNVDWRHKVDWLLSLHHPDNGRDYPVEVGAKILKLMSDRAFDSYFQLRCTVGYFEEKYDEAVQDFNKFAPNGEGELPPPGGPFKSHHFVAPACMKAAPHLASII